MIRSKFGCSVSPISSSSSFFLVASFGRCKFRLCSASVGTLLQATIGGVAEDFDVVPLSDRVFRFSVSSRWVGFHIFKLRSFECNLFKVFFHLWGNGGPRWISEWKAYCKEEASSWSSAASGRSKPAQVFTRSKASYAEVVKSNPLTGANAIPVKNQLPERVLLTD